jgi:hypothetical protein
MDGWQVQSSGFLSNPVPIDVKEGGREEHNEIETSFTEFSEQAVQLVWGPALEKPGHEPKRGRDFYRPGANGLMDLASRIEHKTDPERRWFDGQD